VRAPRHALPDENDLTPGGGGGSSKKRKKDESDVSLDISTGKQANNTGFCYGRDYFTLLGW
jgi:hypothetical protein